MVSHNKSLRGKPTSDCSALAKEEPRKYYKNVSVMVQCGAQGKEKAEERLPASLVTRPVISHSHHPRMAVKQPTDFTELCSYTLGV